MAFPILYCCVTVNKKVKIRQKIKGLRDSFNEEKYTCYIPFALKKDISEYYNDKEFLEKIISFIFKNNYVETIVINIIMIILFSYYLFYGDKTLEGKIA